MWNWKKTGWTLWAITTLLLFAYLASWQGATFALMGILVGQTLLFAWRDRSLITFPVQLRGFFLLITLVGLVPGFGFLIWAQATGAVAYLLFDYCLLARTLALLPWNRVPPLSWNVVRVALFSSPGNDCIIHVISGADDPAMPGETTLPVGEVA